MRSNQTAKVYLLIVFSASCCAPALAQQEAQKFNPDAHYHLGPDSLMEPGVPRGDVRGPFTLQSAVYPGTQHTYWVYVPAQYDPTTPAALMVFNDGQAFMAPDGDLRAQNVLDNLIYRREIPVMIGIFINPGRRPDQPEPNPHEWGDRTTNRPTEYNTLAARGEIHWIHQGLVVSESCADVTGKEILLFSESQRRTLAGRDRFVLPKNAGVSPHVARSSGTNNWRK